MIRLDQGGRARGFVHELGPHPLLAGLVEHTMVLHSVRAAGPGPWRIVPDASGHLLFHRYLDGRCATLVVGPRTRYVDVPQSTRSFTVAVRLRPGALPALVRVPAWDLRNRAVPIGEALGAPGVLLAERLAAAGGPRDVCSLLQAFLVRLAPATLVDWKVRGLLELLDGGRLGVREAARELRVGERTVRQVTRDLVGIRPKEAARILRAHRAIALGLTGATDAEAAHRAGFADQAHLVREFRRLLGETPRAFRARGRDQIR